MKIQISGSGSAAGAGQKIHPKYLTERPAERKLKTDGRQLLAGLLIKVAVDNGLMSYHG
jgi:hypothetical protein